MEYKTTKQWKFICSICEFWIDAANIFCDDDNTSQDDLYLFLLYLLSMEE